MGMKFACLAAVVVLGSLVNYASAIDVGES